MQGGALSLRQREIVESTLRLVSELGMQELTMKRIAAEIGITEPALYRHFASKADILSALVELLEEERRAIANAAEAAGETRAFLETFFMGHARLFAERPSMTLILFSEELFSDHAGLEGRVRNMMQGTIGLLRERLGRALGEPRDPSAAALLLAGGFRLLVSLWRMEGRGFDLQERTSGFLLEACALLGL